MHDRRLRIAVVGGGIAGIASAHFLQRAHEVTLFEADDRVGGHANGVAVDDGLGGTIDVDTAFLIYNQLHYPSFVAFARELGVEHQSQPAEMSASFADFDRDLHYALSRGADAIFFQRRNLVHPRFYRIFVDLLRFRRRAHADLLRGAIPETLTLGEYLRPYSRLFVENFVAPLACAIWSLPDRLVLEYPARQILQFFENHRLLAGSSGDAWRTFRGSSRVYVRAFLGAFGGAVRTRTPVRRIVRTEHAVHLHTDGGEERFDHVVLATHADVSLALLAEPSPEERALLGVWRYHPNTVLLHDDRSVLHPDRRMWASWNVVKKGGRQVVSYHLNRVQRLAIERDLFLTLDDAPIAPRHLVQRFSYRHPVFDAASTATQVLLPSLNGKRRTSFCGSYAGHGFHEDAVVSALRVASRFGLGLGKAKPRQGSFTHLAPTAQ